MKVVFLLPDMGFGGAERVVSIISKELVDLGHSVDIVCLYGSRVQYEVFDSVKVLDFSKYNTDLYHRIIHLHKYLRSEKKIYHQVVAVAFQSSCLNSVLFASVFTGVRVVSTERSNPYKKGTSAISRLRASIPFLLSDLGVFQTNDARAYYHLMPDKKSVVISNPITPSSISWKHNLTPSGIISVCRLHPGKNLKMSFDAIARLKPKYPNIHLDVFGAGHIEGELKEQVKDLELEENISFKGNTNRVLEELSQHSVYISTSNYEGVSNSMLEAMSVGMPIVCTDCPIGGARMMLEDNCGLLSPVGDVDGFVEKLDYVLSHPQQALIMADNARNKTINYSPQNVAKEWERVLTNLF